MAILLNKTQPIIIEKKLTLEIQIIKVNKLYEALL